MHEETAISLEESVVRVMHHPLDTISRHTRMIGSLRIVSTTHIAASTLAAIASHGHDQ